MMNILCILLIFLLAGSEISPTNSKENKITYISYDIFVDYILIVLNQENDTSDYQLVFSQKSDTSKIPFEKYERLSVGKKYFFSIKSPDEPLITKRYDNPRVSNTHYHIPDSLCIFAYGLPPYLEIIWENDTVRGEVFVSPNIYHDYIELLE